MENSSEGTHSNKNGLSISGEESAGLLASTFGVPQPQPYFHVCAPRMQLRMNVLYQKTSNPKEDFKHKTSRLGCMLTCLRGMVGTHGMMHGGISGAWVPGMSWVSRVHAWRWAVGRLAMWRWSVMATCILRSCLLLHLLTSLHLSVLQLLHVERLSLRQKLLPLELQL